MYTNLSGLAVAQNVQMNGLWLYFLGAILLGFDLDLMIGDPHSFPHIVRGIGKMIAFFEQKLRRVTEKSPKREIFAGAILVVLVLCVSVLIPFVILLSAYSINLVLGMLVEGVIIYQLIATKSLKDESMKVYHSLCTNNLDKARHDLSMIVGRDTENLHEAEICRATVETIAENTSDGVIAPMFFVMFFGAVGGVFYKAVNTMDSMIGYKNEQYEYFGRVAAKLDDLVNFIPARLAAMLMIVSAGMLGLDAKRAFVVWKRDKNKHASPNSAQTEAVCAGALGVQLAGSATYAGKIIEKPTIGDAVRPIAPEDIKKANRLLYLTAVLMMILVVISRGILYALV